MLRGQKYYIEKMLPEKIKTPLVTTDFNTALRWLHNNFNRCFMSQNRNYAGGFLYVDKRCGPSDYKKRKAVTYLNRYAIHEMPADIQEGSPIYMKCAAVYYYAAKIIKHYFSEECNIWLGDVKTTVCLTIDRNIARLRKDHYACVERKARKIASLTTQLSAEYKQLEKLLRNQPKVLAKHIEKGVLEYAEGYKNM